MPTNPHRPMSKRSSWQICYWSGVVILFAWAVWQRFALPLDPIADSDTWGYLSPALRKLIGVEFGHTSGRNFIYPGFVYLLLRIFRDFRAITVAQHFFGLLAGGILLLTWQRVRVFVAHPRVGSVGYNALGLLAAAVFLLASEPIHCEMQLRPEGACAFLFSINLYFVIQFAACCFIEGRQAASAACGVTAVLTSILLASVKPAFALAAIVALLPIAIFFFRPGWFRQKIVLAGGAAASATLLLLPEHLVSRNDEVSETFLPTTLFVVHANLIHDQIADDLEHNAKVPYSREWLERVYTILSAEIAKRHAAIAGHYASLGFDHDDLMLNPNSISVQLRRESANDVSALCAFYRFYYWRIWRQRPLRVFKRIARQMMIFYAPVCPVYRQTKFLPLANEYDRGVISFDRERFRKIWTAYPPAVEFMARTEVLARTAPVVQQRAYIRKPLHILAATYLISILIALVLSATVLSSEEHRRRLGWLAVLVLFTYSYNIASCLEVAVFESLEVRRFITVQMFPALLAQFFTLWFILEFALEMRARKKSSCSDTGSIYRSRLDVRCE